MFHQFARVLAIATISARRGERGRSAGWTQSRGVMSIIPGTRPPCPFLNHSIIMPLGG